jgi:hypothetical protein
MLDLNHPHSEHVFAAGRLEDGLLERAKQMTLLPSTRRCELQIECQELLAKMRALNREHFQDSVFISDAISELERSVISLAELQNRGIREDKSEGKGCCSACGTQITNFEFRPSMPREVYCGRCLDIIMPALEKLRSADGFGTDFI